MQKLENPFPQFQDSRGALLDAGYIWVGLAGQDPKTNPVATFWDAALAIPAPQPFRTLGGLIVNGASPAFVFIDADDYSFRVEDADNQLVTAAARTQVTGSGEEGEFQPLSYDLTQISALNTNPFGRSLLTLNNATEMRAAAGIVDALPKTGGTVSGNIVRQGGGSHLYHTDTALASGRVFLTAAGASDPTSLPGDIWLTW